MIVKATKSSRNFNAILQGDDNFSSFTFSHTGYLKKEDARNNVHISSWNKDDPVLSLDDLNEKKEELQIDETDYNVMKWK